MRKKFKLLGIFFVIICGLFIWTQTSQFKRENKKLSRSLRKQSLYLKVQRKYQETNYDIRIKSLQLTRMEKTLALSSIFFVLGIGFFRFKKKGGRKKLDRISESIEIVIKEKTDEPLLVNGNPKTDKLGKKIFKVKEYYPTYDFSGLPEYFKIKKLNPRAERNLFVYLHGLLSKLKKEGYIETSSGKVSSTGFPGEYEIFLNNKSQIGEMEFFKEIRWVKEVTVNGITKEVFPTVDIGEKNVIVVLNGIQLTKATVERGLEKFQKYYKIKLKDFFKQEDDVIEFSYQTKLKRLFVKEDIPSKWKEWNDKIIKPMKTRYEESGVEEIFLGELEDPNINWGTQIYWKLTQSPHLLVVGQTRSGKTRSNLSLITTLKSAYPSSSFLFADGKGSVDYDPFAERMSDYPVAKPAPDNDSLIELANIISIAWKEYDNRRLMLDTLKRETGSSFTSYVQYNIIVKEKKAELKELVRKKDELLLNPNVDHDTTLQAEKENLDSRISTISNMSLVEMPRFFIVIDEFAAFVALSPVAVDKLLTAEGSVFYYLKRLLAESASVGFTLIMASQRAQNDSFPTPIRSNLTSWLIHSVNSKDAAFLGVEGHVEKQSSGKFILKTPGLWCSDTGQTLFKMSLPYIGDNEGPLLDLLDLELREHEEFDYDLIYNSGIDLSGKNMDIRTVYKHIKQAFIIREGYSVIESIDPEFNYLSLMFSDDEGKYYSIGVVNVDEIQDLSFVDKIKQEREDYYEYLTLFFVIGKNGRIAKGMSEALPRASFLFEHDFTRKLKEALDLNKNKDPKKIFSSLIKYSFSNENKIDDVFEVDTKKEDKIINLKELNRIRNISGNVEKGDAFEDWYMEFENRLGYNTVGMRDVIKEGFFPDIFSNKRADGGLDLCRWIDKSEKKAIAIQLKNQSSKALNTDPIDKMVKTRALYKSKGIDFVELLLVTSGKVTKQARKEAEFCGVTIVDGKKLEEMIRNYNKSPGEIVLVESPKRVKNEEKEEKIEVEKEEIPFLKSASKKKTKKSSEEEMNTVITTEDQEFKNLVKLFGEDRAKLIKEVSSGNELINSIRKKKDDK